MSSQRLALVVDDQRVATAIQAHLTKGLGQCPLVCRFDGIRQHLGRETDGLLLLAAVTSTNVSQVLRLVQEIALQKLPPILILLEADALPESRELSRLEPHIAHRLRWPADAQKLIDLLQYRLGRVHGFLATGEESLPAVISRQLLRMTPSLLPLVERLALAAAHDVTVLLTGETGTGKTFLARLMHECSPRRNYPFLTVSCGALPANLVESAFFGHVKGAFTGADRARVGKFAAAGQGTILLDEIDTLGLEHQASLLRVIETGEYEPVGSNETEVCAARIIVASNWNLEEAVERGILRRDLYYRLNVISFHLPPLRERLQDLGPLVRGMAARFNTKFGKDLFDISPEALAALESFPWPGNIRQLENVIQQAVLVSAGPELLLQHLPDAVREQSAPAGGNGRHAADSLLHNREVLERNLILRALASNDYRRTSAARALGISRVTLYKKMNKYGLMNCPLRGPRSE